MMKTTCTYDELIFDEACVVLKDNSKFSKNWLYSLSSDCHSCPYTRISQIPNSANWSVKFNTAKSLSWRVVKNDYENNYLPASNISDVICELIPNLGSFGLYELTVNNYTCKINTIKEPSNSYIPFVTVIGVLLCLLIGISVFKTGASVLKKRFKGQRTNEAIEKIPEKRRIRSIDTCRGISILFMIFVNDGAGGYVLLEHATWNGLLLGDLVFPCFMWIMGICIPFALTSQLARGIPRLSICWTIVKRSAILFGIGVSLNTLGTNAQLENIRIFGVLQRFSIVYLTIALIFVLLSRRKPLEVKNPIFRSYVDILALLPQWIVILGIVAIHCAITFGLPVPDCPTGYLGPGGCHEDRKYWKCVGGSAGYIDRIVLGVDHIYQYPTVNTVYGSGPFDPEGILGCLSSMFQVFLGLQAGMILRYYEDWKNRATRWLLWATICGSAGSILHFTNTIPVNKNLWSLSFVMITTCFALVLLTVCYLLIDVVKVWHGGPFRIPGMNALVMYIGHQLCYQIFPFHWWYGSMNTHAWRLSEALWGVSLWTFVAYVLHWKRIYVTL